jgi:hypothetical protein
MSTETTGVIELFEPSGWWPRRGTYTGGIADGKPNGRGVFVGADEWPGWRYDGEWVNGDMHGRGELQMGNGECYVGEFEYGNLQGRGELRLGGDARRFDGEWNQKYAQCGTVVDSDGAAYRVEFLRMGGGGVYWTDVEDAINRKSRGTWTRLPEAVRTPPPPPPPTSPPPPLPPSSKSPRGFENKAPKPPTAGVSRPLLLLSTRSGLHRYKEPGIAKSREWHPGLHRTRGIFLVCPAPMHIFPLEPSRA